MIGLVIINYILFSYFIFLIIYLEVIDSICFFILSLDKVYILMGEVEIE